MAKDKKDNVEDLLNELVEEGFVSPDAPEATGAEGAQDDGTNAAASEEHVEIDLSEAEAGPTVEDELREERDQLKERLMRALAEAENARKRGERDRRDAEVYGGSRLARDLLSVYDNMKRAVELTTPEQREAAKPVIEGIELTMRELVSTFGKHKIVPVNPAVGEKFDPKIHQAVFEAPVPDVANGCIIQTMSEGFLIGDRLLRPAQVGVSSAPAKKADKGDQPEE